MLADTIVPEPGAARHEAEGEPPLQGSGAPGRVVPGQRWNERYDVVGSLAETGGDEAKAWYRATEVGSDREVWLRTFARGEFTEGRAAIFGKLQAAGQAHGQRLVGAQVTDEEVVQIWEPLPRVTLRRWRAEHSEPSAELTTRLVRHVAEAIEGWQTAGAGHFRLSAERIFVEETPEGPEFVVGGLDRCVAIDQSELIAIKTEVLWAPPETAGLFKHSPGAALLAWDWWSLGRIVQEFVMGRHVVESLPEDLKARLPQSMDGRAEALLFERVTGTLRAGAVELMGDGDKRVGRLLRGLLTSAVEGRWDAGEVRAWLEGEMPAEHYHSPRNERFFQIDGRRLAVAAAADRLLGPAHEAAVEDQALAADKPGMLAHFLAGSPTHGRERDQLQAIVALEKSTALARVDPALRRRIVATLGLNSLAMGHLRWRGRVVNAENLRAEFDRPGGSAVLRAELTVLAEPVLMAQVRRHDHAAADLLEEMVKLIAGAEAFFGKKLGLRPAALGDPAKLWQLALKGEAALTAKQQELKTRYALTTVAAVKTIFEMEYPPAAIALVLARMADEPARFGFLTHEEVRQRRLEGLRKQSAALGKIIFWRRLATAITAGPMVFGRRWLFAGVGAGAILALAVHVPGPMGLWLGLAPVAAALGLRLVANRLQAAAVARWVAPPVPWGWRDGTVRCEAEVNGLGREIGQPTALAAVQAEWRRLDEEWKTVATASDRAKPVIPPRPLTTWAVAAAGWALTLLLVAGSMRQGYRHPPSWTEHVEVWQEVVNRTLSPSKEGADTDKLSWPYRPSLIEAPLEMNAQGDFQPTPEQLNYALARARQLLSPYSRSTVNALVAVYVPLEDGRGALMFFDGKKDAMQGKTGALVSFVPFARSWIQVGDKRAVFIEK